MKKIYLLILLSVLLVDYASAQYSENIRTARPGKAVGPFTSGQKVFQIQTGLAYQDFKNNNNDQSGNYLEHLTSLRYGILERFEIRSAFKLRQDRVRIDKDNTQNFGGLNFWNAGVRYNLMSGVDFKPSFGLQTDLKLTWVDSEYRADNIAPRLMIIHGQKLSETFRITNNLSFSTNGNDSKLILGYVVNISFAMSKKLKGFVENYGEANADRFQSKWDTGIAYLVNKDFQLDLSGGFGENEGVTDWFVDAGISWRVRF